MAKADKITTMKLVTSMIALNGLKLPQKVCLSAAFYFTFASCLIASPENKTETGLTNSRIVIEDNPESDPIAFSSSYLGLSLNQNHPVSSGKSTWSRGGSSWGAEYRFFYKDTWTLSISGLFKNLVDLDGDNKSIFSISQETTHLIRVYHPWYLGVGGRLSYYVPVRKISVPYERDQSRSIDTGAAIMVSGIYIVNPRLCGMISANRWRSLSSSYRHGYEFLATALLSIR